MNKNFKYYQTRLLNIFAFFLILVAMLSAISFILKENYTSAMSSFFGVAIGYILLTQLTNNKNQLHIIESLSQVFDAMDKTLEQRDKQIENNTFPNTNIADGQIYMKTFDGNTGSPEDLTEFLNNFQNMFAEAESANKKNDDLPEMDLNKKLDIAIQNEDYEEAKRLKNIIDTLNPPKE